MKKLCDICQKVLTVKTPEQIRYDLLYFQIRTPVSESGNTCGRGSCESMYNFHVSRAYAELDR